MDAARYALSMVMADCLDNFLAGWKPVAANPTEYDLDGAYDWWLDWMYFLNNTIPLTPDTLESMWPEAIAMFGPGCVMAAYQRSPRVGRLAINKDHRANTTYWLKWLKVAGYTKDFQPAQRPAEPIRLYRGCCWEGRFRLSWTPDLELARMYAMTASYHAHEIGKYALDPRYSAGRVYLHMAQPTEILAVDTQPEINEYVVDVAALDDWTVREVACISTPASVSWSLNAALTGHVYWMDEDRPRPPGPWVIRERLQEVQELAARAWRIPLRPG